VSIISTLFFFKFKNYDVIATRKDLQKTMYYQLLAHLVGDYVLQSKWMAVNKSKRSLPALIHVLCYTIPFLFLTNNILALAIIAGTHFVIDRFQLAYYVCKLRDMIEPRTEPCTETTPIWLHFWLTVIVDNTLHLVINAAALTYCS